MSDGKTSLNLELLIKLLKLTTSSNDSEALLSCRKANEQLAKFGGDWEALLHGKVTVIADPFTAAAPTSEQIHRRTAAPPAPTPPAPPRPTPPPPTAPPRTPYSPPGGSYYQAGIRAKQQARAHAKAAATAAAQTQAAPTRNTLRKQRVQLDDIA